jgi:hypothetical protein
MASPCKADVHGVERTLETSTWSGCGRVDGIGETREVAHCPESMRGFAALPKEGIMERPKTQQQFFTVLIAAVLACFGIGPAGAVGPNNMESFPVTVINPDDDPVPTADVYAPGRRPVRIGPVHHGFLPSDGIPAAGFELLSSVDSGQTLILTHLNAIAFSNLSNVPFEEAACSVYLKTPQGSSNVFTSFLRIPLETSGNGSFYGSMQLFIPLNAGEGLNVLCVGEPLVSQGFRVTAGGYLVSDTQQPQ